MMDRNPQPRPQAQPLYRIAQARKTYFSLAISPTTVGAFAKSTRTSGW
jgi:hypothetical protein